MSVKKALLHSFVEKYLVLCLQLVTTAIVSRLISPKEFAVFALALSVTMLAQVFRDLGVGQYLIQEKELTVHRMRAALTILSLSSVVLFAGVVLSRNLVAEFYSNADIASVLLIISFSLLTMPFGALTLAALRREMQFKRVAFVGISSSFATSIVTIALAYRGFSFFCFAWGMLAGALTTVACAVSLRPRALPLLPGVREIRHVVRYSSLATFNGLLETLEDRLGSLLLGRFSSFQDIGLYERGTSVAQMFQRIVMQGVWNVALPAFAQLSRTGQMLAESYAKAVGIVCSLGVVFFLWLIVYADLVVSLLLGPSWSGTTPVVRLIAIASLFGLPNALSGSMLIGVGQIKLQTVVTAVLRGSSLIAIAIGAPHGAEGIATCLIVSSVLSNGWLTWRLREYCPVGLIGKTLWRTVRIALPTVLLAYGLRLCLGPTLIHDIAGFALSFALWLGLLARSHDPLWNAVFHRPK